LNLNNTTKNKWEVAVADLKHPNKKVFQSQKSKRKMLDRINQKLLKKLSKLVVIKENSQLMQEMEEMPSMEESLLQKRAKVVKKERQKKKHHLQVKHQLLYQLLLQTQSISENLKLKTMYQKFMEKQTGRLYSRQ